MEVMDMMKKIIVVLMTLALVGGVFTACKVDTAPRVTVTFEDPDGGNEIEPVIIEKGDSLDKDMPTDLTREGPFLFYGWFDGASQYFPDTPIGADITLTARWSLWFTMILRLRLDGLPKMSIQ